MNGRIIFLNGTSCAGKTTLVHALRPKLEPQFYYYASDQLADQGFRPLDPDVRAAGRERFFTGFHHSLPACRCAELPYELAGGREPDVYCRWGERVHRTSPLLQQGLGERPAGGKAEEVIEGMPIGQLRARGRDRVEHHPAQLSLGRRESPREGPLRWPGRFR